MPIYEIRSFLLPLGVRPKKRGLTDSVILLLAKPNAIKLMPISTVPFSDTAVLKRFCSSGITLKSVVSKPALGAARKATLP